MRRYSRNVKNTSSNYIHRFRPLHLTNDAYKSKDKLKQFCLNSEHMPNDILYKEQVINGNNNNNNNNPNRRRRKPKEKNSKELRAAVDTKCKQIFRECKPNIQKFDNDTFNATPEQVSDWLRHNAAPSFRPSAQALTDFESRGFHIANIMHLVLEQSVNLRADLQLNEGQWSALLSIFDKIFRGDVVFMISNPAANAHPNNNNNRVPQNMNRPMSGNQNANSNNNNMNRPIPHNNNNQNANSNNNNMNRPMHNNNNQNGINPNMNSNNMQNNNANNNNNNDENNHDITTNTKNNDAFDEHNLWKNIARRQYEPSSNHKQRARQGRIHLYFSLRGSNGVYMSGTSTTKGGDVPVFDLKFTSSLGHSYCCQKKSKYFKFYDCDVLERVMLRLHNCTKLHPRILAQRDIIQNVLTNKRLLSDWAQNVRISASGEFMLGITIGEGLELLVRIADETKAFTYNQMWMRNDNFADDFELGSCDPPFDGYNRVPRSTKQITDLKKEGKSVVNKTLWFARSDPFKLHQKLTKNNIDKWTPKLKQWDDFGVLKWMPTYLSRYFPGQEQKAKDIGLLKYDNDAIEEMLLDDEKHNADFSIL